MKSVNRIALGLLLSIPTAAMSALLNLSDGPLTIGRSPPPLAMLVMQRDHQLFYEAYNDAADLDGDGLLDIGFKTSIEYFGYFDGNLCYTYNLGIFVPSSNAVTSPSGAPRACAGAAEWSGNWLNYVTTSRMDALRKVLYGGHRYLDAQNRTILERTYIPQESHTWGKDYSSVAENGYDIRDFTPLNLPAPGAYHSIANVTLYANGQAGNSQPPLMRVLTNTPYMARQWVSIQAPVAGSECDAGGGRIPCVAPLVSGRTWMTIATRLLENLSTSYYRWPGGAITNQAQFTNAITTNAVPANLCGTHTPNVLAGMDNPFYNGTTCLNTDFLSVTTGRLRLPETTTVLLAMDVNDAGEIIINGTRVNAQYGSNAYNAVADTATAVSYTFLANTDYNIELRYAQRSGPNGWGFYWSPGVFTSAVTNYIVRVEVCSNPAFLEDNCQVYANGNYKPVGLLHEYGENNSMFFGLISGSYEKNISGGVLRRNISSFTEEIDPRNGRFTAINGIARTLSKLSIVDYGGNYAYPGCGQPKQHPQGNGQCKNWGNPISEMIYETLRYFAGLATPTDAYDYGTSNNAKDVQSDLNLTTETWRDPYDTYPWCAKPVQLLISDINPNHDSDEIPGTYFPHPDFVANDPLPGFNASTEADRVWRMEFGASGVYLIGHSGTVENYVPSPKTVTSFANIRGLSPEHPAKKGSYYGAGLAYFARTNDLNPVRGDQTMETFAVALASPQPRIEIDVNGRTITLVPFGKSVGGCFVNANNSTDYMPTNSMTDMYIESISPTAGVFRGYFEDVEHGNSYDVDAIVKYEYQVVGDRVDVTLTSEYSFPGSCTNQHIGYVVSGSTADGAYLEVRDRATSEGSDADYFLDTPPGALPNTVGAVPNGIWDDGVALPLQTSRSFVPGDSTNIAKTLKSPIWFATKYGGFLDEDGDGTPANTELGNAEWDEDGDGEPDNYFLVTNALGLSDQLARAFERILNRTSSASALAVNAGSLRTETVIYQARFDPLYWTGELRAIRLDSRGVPEEEPVWDAGAVLTNQSLSTRQIISYNPQQGRGIPFRWPTNSAAPTASEFSATQMAQLLTGYMGADVDEYGRDLVAWLRGSTAASVEQPFREREKLLGDIITSDPLFVGSPRRGYPDAWADMGPENNDPYSAFVSAHANRLPIVYVGANDGMLHGFQATTTEAGSGSEKLAYIPSMVYSNLNVLTSPLYNSDRHKYFVDGPAKVDDVYFGGDWHTVLIGTLGKGGQGVFALDITDPSDFDESNSSTLALWEFSDADDADLGYSYGNVSIGRFYNQEWLVAVGNGHNNTENDGLRSTTGNGVIYLLDVRDGSIVKKFDTGAGMVQDPTGQNRNNGVLSPALVDLDGDFIIDVIYAGDLFGNVWKIDVRGSNETNWDFSFSSGAVAEPLFVATDANGVAQPITAPIEIGRFPIDGPNVMIYFGTGKYIEVQDSDNVGQQTQSIYGLIDTNDASAQISRRSELLEQTFILESEVTPIGAEDPLQVRISSDTPIDYAQHKGWFIDLVDGNNPTDNRGERVIRKVTVRSGRIIATTLQPDEDPCNRGGGTGWLLAFNAFSGARLDQTPIDVNGDGIYNQDDYVRLPDGTLTPISGVNDGQGTPSSPVIIDRGDDEVYILGTSAGETVVFGGSRGGQTTGRQSWRRIR